MLMKRYASPKHSHTPTHREGKGVEQNEKAQKENEKKEESRKIAKRFLCLFCKIKSNVLVLWGEICFVCRIRHTCLDTILPYYHINRIPYTTIYTIYQATQCSPCQSSGRARRSSREREAACDGQSTAKKKKIRDVIEVHRLRNTLSISGG